MAEVYVPWAFEEELLEVRGKLYSQDAAMKRDAVDCIEMWMMRGNCPHYVASSAYLMDALLRYYHHEGEQLGALTLRSLFGSAITRFVSGFCDIGQNSRSKQAMAEIAKSYGMPPSFIPLRHDITHRELPPLTRLLQASEQAMEWLWQYYWAPLDQPSILSDEDTRLLTAMLKEYLEARKREVQASQAESSAAEDCSNRLAELDRRVASAALRQNLASRLVDRMIPRKRSVGDSMTGAFKIFDVLINKLGIQVDGLLPALMAELDQRLVDSDRQAAGAAGQLDGVARWIGHLLTDKHWTNSNRHARQIQPWRKRVVQTCTMLSGTEDGAWNARLLDELFESAPTRFLEAQGMLRNQP